MDVSVGKGALAQALVKAGIIDQEVLDRKAAEEAAAEKQKKDAARREMEHRVERYKQEQLLLDERMAPFNEMYSNPKTRPRLLHLVWAFILRGDAEKVREFHREPPSGYICPILGCRLMSMEQFFLAFLEYRNSPYYLEDILDGSQKEQHVALFLKGRELAYSSKESNTLLSSHACENMREWVLMKICQGDHTINRLANKARLTVKSSTAKEAEHPKEGE